MEVATDMALKIRKHGRKKRKKLRDHERTFSDKEHEQDVSTNIEKMPIRQKTKLTKQRKRDDDDDEVTDTNVVPVCADQSDVISPKPRSRRHHRKRKFDQAGQTETCEKHNDSNLHVHDDYTFAAPIEKQKKCNVFTNEERSAIGPVWKQDHINEDADDDVIDDIPNFKSIRNEVESMWPDSSDDEELAENSNPEEESESAGSDYDPDGADYDNGNVWDPDRPTYPSRRSFYLLPNVDLNDFKPNSEEEMEHLQSVRIVVDWPIPLLHSRRFQPATFIMKEQAEMKRKQKETRLIMPTEQEADVAEYIRQGPFNYHERRHVIARMDEFRKLYNIRNPLYHLGLAKAKLMKSEKMKFVQFLGKGLNNRTLVTIYQRVRHMYDPYKYVPLKKTKKEARLICHLVKRFGNKWAKIGTIMKRRTETLRLAFQKYNGNYRKGKWTSDEYRRLIAALVALTGERDLRKLHHRLPWTKVSEIMHTRHAYYCRLAWIYVLSKKIFAKDCGPKWNLNDTVRLIEVLHEGQYESELDVPWAQLFPLFGMSNCSQLSTQWSTLRAKVPGYYLKPYESQVEYLHGQYLPIVKDKLKRRAEKMAAAAVDAKLRKESTKESGEC